MLPWESLVERIREIETEGETTPAGVDPRDEPDVKAILAYLDQRGYQMASFDRLRKRVGENIADDRFQEIIKRNATLFRRATLKGNRPGLAKLVP